MNVNFIKRPLTKGYVVFLVTVQRLRSDHKRKATSDPGNIRKLSSSLDIA